MHAPKRSALFLARRDNEMAEDPGRLVEQLRAIDAYVALFDEAFRDEGGSVPVSERVINNRVYENGSYNRWDEPGAGRLPYALPGSGWSSLRRKANGRLWRLLASL